MSLTEIYPPALRMSKPGTAVEVRSLIRSDREPLRTLLVETDVFTDDEVGIALELIDAVLNNPEQKDYIIYCCEANGQVAGYYCIGPTPATRGTFDLYWIAVKPTAQGLGIGGMLNKHAEGIVHSMGGRLLIAETSSQPKYQKTRRFYLTHGYSELARIQDYYRIGDDLVVYGKYLI